MLLLQTREDDALEDSHRFSGSVGVNVPAPCGPGSDGAGGAGAGLETRPDRERRERDRSLVGECLRYPTIHNHMQDSCGHTRCNTLGYADELCHGGGSRAFVVGCLSRLE